MDPLRRTALLELIKRLQVNLAVPTKGEPKPNLPKRFSKKSKSHRHTVGVSREELAAARKLIGDLDIDEVKEDTFAEAKDTKPALQKQNSDGNSGLQPPSGNVQNTSPKPYKPPLVKTVAEPDEKPDNYDTDSLEPLKRYSKKMKRANTIDIPKPAKFKPRDNDDSVLDSCEPIGKRNYLALRGPIWVGGQRNQRDQCEAVPSFEPKTENDKKFAAFIQKHNHPSSIGSMWQSKINENQMTHQGLPEHNWSRKFGNIKTKFEVDAERRGSNPMNSLNSARKFWQKAENNSVPPKNDFKPGKILEQKPKLPWNEKVITGQLRVETTPVTVQKQILPKQYKFIPQPLPVNKFSHAPMSAFKPPQKKLTVSTTQKVEEPKTSDPPTPLYLYTPKEFPDQLQEDSKMVSSPPWAASQTENRVLNLVASKFENVPVEPPKERPKPRKLSGDLDKKPKPKQKKVEKAPKEEPFVPVTVYNNIVTTSYQRSPEEYYPQMYYAPEPQVVHKVYEPEPEKKPLKIFDFPSPEQSPVGQSEPTPPLTEYKAVSKVMVGPVSQQAVTVQQNTPKRREEHDTAANHLQTILQKRSSSKDSDESRPSVTPEKSVSPAVSPRKPEEPVWKTEEGVKREDFAPTEVTISYLPKLEDLRLGEPISYSPFQPCVSPRLAYQEPSRFSPVRNGETVVHDSITGKPIGYKTNSGGYENYRPVSPRQVYGGLEGLNYRLAVSPGGTISSGQQSYLQNGPDRPVTPKRPVSFHQKPPEIHLNSKTITSESYEIDQDGETVLSTKLQIPLDKKVVQHCRVEPRGQSPVGVSKSDSWHQLIPDQYLNTKPSPRASPQTRIALQKAKSSHSLAIPKQFEAGIARDEAEQKTKTVLAYFSDPKPLKKPKRFAKVKFNALSRSQTMPDVSYSDMMEDMDDVDAEFETIFKASVCK